jgi:hypothetical protein
MALLPSQKVLRNRLNQSLANQQATFLGKQRGQRNILDIKKQYVEGYDPMVAGYARRGLIGPDVQSGIARSGLEKYAQSLQKDLGTEQLNTQTQLNDIAMTEATQQADIEDFLAELRLQKQQDILNSAMTLKGLGSY